MGYGQPPVGYGQPVAVPTAPTELDPDGMGYGGAEKDELGRTKPDEEIAAARELELGYAHELLDRPEEEAAATIEDADAGTMTELDTVIVILSEQEVLLDGYTQDELLSGKPEDDAGKASDELETNPVGNAHELLDHHPPVPVPIAPTELEDGYGYGALLKDTTPIDELIGATSEEETPTIPLDDEIEGYTQELLIAPAREDEGNPEELEGYEDHHPPVPVPIAPTELLDGYGYGAPLLNDTTPIEELTAAASEEETPP